MVTKKPGLARTFDVMFCDGDIPEELGILDMYIRELPLVP